MLTNYVCIHHLSIYVRAISLFNITHNHLISDHKVISAFIKYKSNIYQPKFIRTKNYNIITRNNLLRAVEHPYINHAFNYKDPDLIADIIQTEICSIIDLLTPSKYMQYKKDYIPYYNKEAAKNNPN